MKRVNHLIPAIADPDNLRLAFWKAGKGKRYSRAVTDYSRDLDVNLSALRDQILSGNVQTGDYIFFKIFEPKERQICAADFSEQVMHHSIMNICHPFFERTQLFDSYASRIGKGTYAAIDRARFFSRKYAWYVKLDVRKFFASIHHQVLKGQLRRMFKDRILLDIFAKIIDSYEERPGRGVPIGNLTSQYFANHYLSPLDHLIRERLRIRAYVRYMDDMVLWCDSKKELVDAFSFIRDYVECTLKCELKPKTLNKTRLGLSFLGYRIFPHYLHLTQKSKCRFIRKMGIIEANFNSGKWDPTTCQRHVLPLLAFIRHADSTAFRAKLFHIHS
jgi:retron-type reverse transcriptase